MACALLSNHSRCCRHSLSRDRRRYATRTNRAEQSSRRRVDEPLASIFRKQRQRPCIRCPLLDRLDRLAPPKVLQIVDLAQIRHVALHNPPTADAPVLHNAESPVLLAVLPPNLAAQKHTQDSRSRPGRAMDLVGTTTVSTPSASKKAKACAQKTRQKSRPPTPVGELGLARRNSARVSSVSTFDSRSAGRGSLGTGRR